MLTFLSNAFCAGAGAFAGALAAYFLACRREEKRLAADYVNFLLMIYDQLDGIYSILKDIPPEFIKKIDGKEVAEFTMPLPNLDITSQQMKRLIEVSPDKQMPSALFHLKSFIDTQRWRVIKCGKSFHEMEDIRQYSRQLKFMLMSVRVQYEQQTNADFPLE